MSIPTGQPATQAAVFDVYGPGAPFLTAAVGVAAAFVIALRLKPVGGGR